MLFFLFTTNIIIVQFKYRAFAAVYAYVTKIFTVTCRGQKYNVVITNN